MDYEKFKELSNDEQKAIISGYEDTAKKFEDLTAENNSLKKELEEKNLVIEEGKKDLAATKELNYTLARKVNSEKDKKSFEQTLHDIFKRGEYLNDYRTDLYIS